MKLTQSSDTYLNVYHLNTVWGKATGMPVKPTVSFLQRKPLARPLAITRRLAKLMRFLVSLKCKRTWKQGPRPARHAAHSTHRTQHPQPVIATVVHANTHRQYTTTTTTTHATPHTIGCGCNRRCKLSCNT